MQVKVTIDITVEEKDGTDEMQLCPITNAVGPPQAQIG